MRAKAGQVTVASCKLALCSDREAARRLHLDEHARVLVFGTEGNADAELYTRIIGESGDQVGA